MAKFIKHDVKWAYVCSSQHSSSKRRICNDGHAEFAAGLQQTYFLIFYVEEERRVFNLNSRDRMDSMRATKGGRRALGKTQVSDFPFPIGYNGFQKLEKSLSSRLVRTYLTSSTIAPTVTYIMTDQLGIINRYHLCVS